MTRRLVYVIGEPGVGKSTTLGNLVPDDAAWVLKPFAHAIFQRDGAPAVYLGRTGGAFPGTDRLGMSVQPAVIAWLDAQTDADLVIGEGDRLGNLKFLNAAVGLGYEVRLVHCVAPDDVIAARRVERGSNQNETWLAGRRTKVRNVANEWLRRAEHGIASYDMLSTAAALDDVRVAFESVLST